MKKLVKDRVVLLGYSATGECVYSDQISCAAFLCVRQPWHDPETVKQLGLVTLRAFVFDPEGRFLEEIDNDFSPDTGIIGSDGWRPNPEGTLKVSLAYEARLRGA